MTPNPMQLFLTLPDVRRHPEMQMAASKPEVPMYIHPIELSKKFQRIYLSFEVNQTRIAVCNISLC